MEPFLAPIADEATIPNRDRRERSMNNAAILWAIVALALACAVAALLLYRSGDEAAPAPSPQAPHVAEAPATAAEPLVRFPIASDASQPLPPLDRSDGALWQVLQSLFGHARLDDLLYRDSIVRRIVATVDNLPRSRAPRAMMPVKPAQGVFEIVPTPRGPAIAAANAGRYTPYVALVRTLDARTAVAAYAALYPLFQRAYEDLGFPGRHFNDRLVETIDHLLAAPDVAGPVILVRPRVFYEFADPDLEALSAGQKLMVRMGSANAAGLKQKLIEIRHGLTQQSGRAP